MHSGLRKAEQSVEQFCSQRSRYIRGIGDYAKVKGVKAGIENEGGDYEDYMQLLEAIEIIIQLARQLMLDTVLSLTK